MQHILGKIHLFDTLSFDISIANIKQ